MHGGISLEALLSRERPSAAGEQERPLARLKRLSLLWRKNDRFAFNLWAKAKTVRCRKQTPPKKTDPHKPKKFVSEETRRNR